MRHSILQNTYIFVGKEEVDYGYNVSWHCLDKDYKFSYTHIIMRTISLKRV